MDRVAITVHLQPGIGNRAQELLDGGPPFDPEQAGLQRHTVYARGDEVVFVFEGEQLEQKLSALLNDPVRAGDFSAWSALLTENPRLAHVVYHWDRQDDSRRD